jgi:N-acetylneuraminic acid mutarotase
MPTARYALATAVIDGKIYAIGGRSTTQTYANNEMYDPISDRWISKALMPTARYGLGVAEIGGEIYAVGGFNPQAQDHLHYLSSVEVYDPITNSWMTSTPMITPRQSLAVAALGGHIYAIGGVVYQGPNQGVQNKTEMYDPASHLWSPRTDLPVRLQGMSAVVLAGQIYLFGGFNDQGLSWEGVEVYDPLKDAWGMSGLDRSADGSTDHFYAYGAAAVGNVIYAFGHWERVGHLVNGMCPSCFSRNATIEYDPSIPSWTIRVAIPTLRQDAGTVSSDGNVYVIGGRRVSTTTSPAMDSNEEYTQNPTPTSSTQNTSIPGQPSPSVPLWAWASIAVVAIAAAGIVVLRLRHKRTDHPKTPATKLKRRPN